MIYVLVHILIVYIYTHIYLLSIYIYIYLIYLYIYIIYMREKEREKKLFNEKFACMTLGPVSTHDLNEQAGQPKVYYIPDRLQSPGDLAS